MFKYLVGGVVNARKQMKAPEYTRANQWAAHAKEGKLQKKAQVSYSVHCSNSGLPNGLSNLVLMNLV